jgi:hypothetical protein
MVNGQNGRHNKVIKVFLTTLMCYETNELKYDMGNLHALKDTQHCMQI